MQNDLESRYHTSVLTINCFSNPFFAIQLNFLGKMNELVGFSEVFFVCLFLKKKDSNGEIMVFLHLVLISAFQNNI